MDIKVAKKLSLTICVFLGVVAGAGEAVNFATAQEKLNSRFGEIESVLAQAVKDQQVAGHCALALHNGKVIYRNHWGFQDRENELPIGSDTIFRIYSMSKPVTSVAAMQLVEQGQLELDAPVAKYMPEFKQLKVLDDGVCVQPLRPMTVRDLMRHTSGLTYGFFGDSEVDLAYRKNQILIFDRNLEEMVGKLGKIPLCMHPGQKFHYSVATDVLGRLIEVVSGKRFGKYLRTNVFEPLGMKDTFFTVPKDKRERLAQMYTGKNDKLQPASLMQSYRYLNENDFESGGGGLCSTMDDYLQFCRMLLNQGSLDGNRILKQESLQEMFTNQLKNVQESSPSFQFGLGFRISNRGDYGWGGMAGTRFWVNPDKGLAVLYMTQINPYSGRQWANKFRDFTYEIIDSNATSSE